MNSKNRNTAWDIMSILKELTRAANILLNDKDYDGHGWELIWQAQKEAEKIINNLPNNTQCKK